MAIFTIPPGASRRNLLLGIATSEFHKSHQSRGSTSQAFAARGWGARGAWACTCRAWGIGKLEAEVEPIFIRLRFRSRVLVQVGVNLVCQHGENIWENPFVNMFQSGKRTILNHINQFFQTLWHVCRVQTYYSQPLDLILPQKEWQTRCWCWICR